MRIALITPAGRGSRAGNRATAVRWARILSRLGHRPRIEVDYAGAPCDLMIALHAWRSAESVQRYAERYPDRPLILALTGTDLYRFQYSHPETTHRAMQRADRLVVLHEAAYRVIPPALHPRVRVIVQSAEPLRAAVARIRRHFQVCVVGHLREEKDPFRTAWAARRVPPASRLRVVHVGRGHTPEWEEQAREEMARNPRYRWRGEVPHWQVRRLMARSHLMVLSSRMEGGANVISEALTADLPVIASRIDGSVGLLGEDYAGYYPVTDTQALADCLWRAESDAPYYQSLLTACRARAPRFTPEREAAGWAALLAELGAAPPARALGPQQAGRN